MVGRACRYVKGGLSRSLTVRNLQLSLYGLPFSMAYMWLKDGVARSNMIQVGLSKTAFERHPTSWHQPSRSVHIWSIGVRLGHSCTRTCIRSSRAHLCTCRALTWWRGQ